MSEPKAVKTGFTPIEVAASAFKQKEQVMETLRKRNNVRLYVCGGGAGSVALSGQQSLAHDTAGLAKLDVCYIDTSDSDIVGKVPADQCYFFKGKDGSGQMRATNFEDIVAYTKEIIQKFPASDLNIVLALVSGGSGSTIAHELVRELLKRDSQVIVLGIGSINTKRYLQNTISTLKTFEAVSYEQEKPVVMHYMQNPEPGKKYDYTRGDVDANMCEMVNRLRVLYSGQNTKLDSKDLEHWLNYNLHTDARVGLVALNCFDQDQCDGIDGHNDITIASLLAENNGDPTYFNNNSQPAEYQTYGIVPAGTKAIANQVPLHFVISDGFFQDTLEDLTTKLANIVEVADSRVSRGGVVKKDELATNKVFL